MHLSGWQAEKSIAAQRQSSYGITYLRCDRASSCFIYIQQARRRERWNLSQTLDGLYVNYFSHHLVISKASITSSSSLINTNILSIWMIPRLHPLSNLLWEIHLGKGSSPSQDWSQTIHALTHIEEPKHACFLDCVEMEERANT